MRMLRTIGTWVVAGGMLLAAGAGWSQTNPAGGGTPPPGGGSAPTGSGPVKGTSVESYSPSGDAAVGVARPSAAQANSANAQSSRMKSLDQDTQPMSPEALQAKMRNTDRQKQLVDDTTKLLSLAKELKDEVDKSTKDTLSLDVVRKAEEIEKLAHTVKDRMKCSGCGGGPGVTP